MRVLGTIDREAHVIGTDRLIGTDRQHTAEHVMNMTQTRARGRGPAQTLLFLLSVVIGGSSCWGDVSLAEGRPPQAESRPAGENAERADESISLQMVPSGNRSEAALQVADLMQGAGSPNGAGGQAGAIIVRQIGSHVFHIPKGYISSFLGYAGYVQIHALLPCLDPETSENTEEFHRVDPGRILIATLNVWGSHYLEGEQLLKTHIENSQFVQGRHPAERQIDIGPTDVSGTNFLSYKDILLNRSLFTLRGSHPLFLVDCDNAKYVPFPTCSLWKRILGGVRLYYWYSRFFLDQDMNNSIKIDARLLKLFSSFLDDPQQREQLHKGETCNESVLQ